jgi:hypothetical protein
VQNSTDRGVAWCRGCGGWAYRGDRDGRPYGWLTMSVNVPPGMGRNGKPWIWVGMFCCTACLAEALPALQKQETVARQEYDATMPRHDQRPGRQESGRRP